MSEATPSNDFDPKNYKRCKGQCHRLRPIRDFQVPRNKVCMECRGLRLDASGAVRAFTPEIPRAVTPRKNAALYPLDSLPGYSRYQREKAKERYDAKRATPYKPPRWPSARLVCVQCPKAPKGRNIWPRHMFPERGRICKACLEKEAKAIADYRLTTGSLRSSIE